MERARLPAAQLRVALAVGQYGQGGAHACQNSLNLTDAPFNVLAYCLELYVQVTEHLIGTGQLTPRNAGGLVHERLNTLDDLRCVFGDAVNGFQSLACTGSYFGQTGSL